ncbi:hypothetical protein BS50DRAFT_113851 [Corynespora cassiicola Philippines]|uniref:Uncharacterized protein n=1 Tax=Corynespora cassiicola Philippines TaxID=1448308 RepID=A0A2T2NEK1_CORCC|nr:hypothetical protein BS50DRAFT_113851 [Corynespora cassiicola Philippines]
MMTAHHFPHSQAHRTLSQLAAPASDLSPTCRREKIPKPEPTRDPRLRRKKKNGPPPPPQRPGCQTRPDQTSQRTYRSGAGVLGRSITSSTSTSTSTSSTAIHDAENAMARRRSRPGRY